MHHKLVHASARTAVIGAAIVLGSTAAAQGAMAGPAPSAVVSVACNTPALMSALSDASSQKLLLAFGCTYVLTAPLPEINTNLTIVGYGASLERSEADDTPDFTILTVGAADVNLIEVNFYNGGDGFDSDDDGDDYAGAIVNDGGNVSVLGGTFEGNASNEYGGAIYNESGTLALNSTYFGYNGAQLGGAIYNEDTMTMRSSHFFDNEAQWGGAIYNSDIATVIGTTFTQDGAEFGGALYSDDQATLSSVTIQDNNAYQGGGIYNDDDLTVASSNIKGNFADENGGGGIFNDDETVSLSRTNVTGNEPENCVPLNTIPGCSN
jgi:predicted outer membrane repeat protein